MAGRGKRVKMKDKDFLGIVLKAHAEGKDRDEIARLTQYKPVSVTSKLQQVRNRLRNGKTRVRYTDENGDSQVMEVQAVLPLLRKRYGKNEELDRRFDGHTLATINVEKIGPIVGDVPDVSWIPTLSGGGARQTEVENIDSLFEFARSLRTDSNNDEDAVTVGAGEDE